jgi:hypothetical protein
MTEMEKEAVIVDFEEQLKQIRHYKCEVCHSVSMSLQYKIESGRVFCEVCASSEKRKSASTLSYLPIWYDDDGNAQYELPLELQDLREGEKLLLQMISPYVPLQHMQYGSYGSKGHSCSFEQAINEVCTNLPRTPEDVNLVRVIKHFKKKNGEMGSIAFIIRKSKVLAALRWLKKYNHVYKDIKICESNLDWMGDNEELELPSHITYVDDEDVVETEDNQERENLNVSGTEKCYGMLGNPPNHGLPSEKDQDVTDTLNQAVKESRKVGATMSFPFVSQKPVDEFDACERVFCKAFPWLFPGGRGDFNSYREEKITVDDWVQNLVYYHDGRFAKDKQWAFFALNYASRKKNQNSGGYFVDGFFDGPKTLDELQDEIRKGDTSWVNRITYYSHRVKGTAAYWRSKRDELYSWINYHVEQGHGAPSLFMTFSCAEYYWPDIIRLIRDRYEAAGLEVPSNLESKSHATIVNDFTLIVQEYFQIRMDLWLKTVGKKLFHIENYWLRYEFAPGRGQIHAHMVAITNDQAEMREYYSLSGDKEAQAKYLGDYVERKYKLTAMFPDCGTGYKRTKEDHPSYEYFSDVDNRVLDEMKCQTYLQLHNCTNYCLRKRKYT